MRGKTRVASQGCAPTIANVRGKTMIDCARLGQPPASQKYERAPDSNQANRSHLSSTIAKVRTRHRRARPPYLVLEQGHRRGSAGEPWRNSSFYQRQARRPQLHRKADRADPNPIRSGSALSINQANVAPWERLLEDELRCLRLIFRAEVVAWNLRRLALRVLPIAFFGRLRRDLRVFQKLSQIGACVTEGAPVFL